MAFELPKNRLNVRQIQTAKRNIPLEQIIAVQGQNPLATGIETAGNAIGQVLTKRAQLRQQGEQIAQLAAMAKGDTPMNPGVLSPDLYEKGSALQVNANNKKATEANARIDRELKLEQLKSGYAETDPLTGAVRSYPGVQGLSIQYDTAGNPFVQRATDYKPKIQPLKSGSGSGGASDDKEWGKLVKEINPQTASSRSTLGMASRANLNADRAIVTLNKPMVTKAELGNVMADIAAIYQGGAPTDQGMSHQDWSTAYGKIMGNIQSLTGNPQDAVPEAIKQRILADLSDMKGINQRSIASNLNFYEKARSGIISRHASEWKNARTELEGSPGLTPITPGLSPAAQRLISKHK